MKSFISPLLLYVVANAERWGPLLILRVQYNSCLEPASHCDDIGNPFEYLKAVTGTIRKIKGAEGINLRESEVNA